MKKIVIILLAAVVVGALGWRIYHLVIGKSGGPARRPERPPVAVEIADVTRASIRDIREFTGTVEPRYRYIVAPKVSGRIIDIGKRIGDSVRKGERIARLDDAEYQQAVLEAVANFTIAQASLAEIQGQSELAKQELDRIQSLRDKGISSTSELDAALTSNTAQQARLRVARAQVEQRQAALNSARIRLSYTVLTAPEPGFVGERFVDEGTLLSPNQPVISVVAIDRVVISTTIVERDYGRIRVGQNATVSVDAYPSDTFDGTVARIAPMLQESSRVAKMEVEVINTALTLKPGMFARVNVVLAKNDSALVVPTQSIVTGRGENSSDGVFLVVQNSPPTVKFVPVETGIVTPDKTEILSPELTGKVVTLGQHLLSDGSTVILPGKNLGGGRGGGRGRGQGMGQGGGRGGRGDGSGGGRGGGSERGDGSGGGSGGDAGKPGAGERRP